MEHCGNYRGQPQLEETILKKRSAKDDDELPHSKKLGSCSDVFSTRRITRSLSKQQHGERKEPKKLPICGPPFREITDEELEAYNKKVEESDGFDVGEVGDVPGDVFINLIRPCQLDRPASPDRPYNKLAKKALAAYNDKWGTKYKFVKHIRVNRKGGAVGSWFYMTFQAKDKKAGSQNFQAPVYSHRGKIVVRFCRVEKKLEEPKGLEREKAKVQEDHGGDEESKQY